MVRPLSNQAATRWDRSLPPSEPDDLKRLGEKIDAAGRKRAGDETGAAPTSVGIAFRLGTELMSAVLVGTGLGWGIDWACQNWASIQTRPWGMVVMFLLGAATGIRNVFRTSQKISADMAPKEK
jgi:ATP synthase protein I